MKNLQPKKDYKVIFNNESISYDLIIDGDEYKDMSRGEAEMNIAIIEGKSIGIKVKEYNDYCVDYLQDGITVREITYKEGNK